MKLTKKQLIDLITENLREMAMDFDTEDRPDQGIQDKLKDNETTFKKTPLPDTGNENQNFQELLASERYKQVVQKVKNYTGVETPIRGMDGLTPLMMQMMGAVNTIISSEKEHREQLQQLAIQMVMKEMAIPEGAVQFDAKIIDIGGVSAENFNTEEMDDEFEIDAEEDLLDTLEEIDFEKAKRRLINSIIQGSSKRGHYMFHNVEDELIEITGNPNIINLYGVMMSINDTMYWQLGDQTIKAMGGGEENMAGKEEVDRNTDPPTIYARGINFPVLVHELIKGMMELFAIQGRTGNDEVDSEVEDSEDNLHKEMWDLRLGPAIWDRLRSQFPEEILIDENQREIQNYLLVEIFKLPAKRFILFMKEVLTGSDRGKQMINSLMEGIEDMLNDMDYQENTQNIDDILTNIEDESDDEDINDFLRNMGFDPDKEY